MRTQDEIIKDIKLVLKDKVAPSVAAHDGAITFISFASYTALNSSLALPLSPFGRYLLIYWAVKICMLKYYYGKK